MQKFTNLLEGLAVVLCIPQLHVTSAPTYFHFPATGKRQPEDTYTDTHTHIHIHTSTHAHTDTHTYTYTQTHTRTHTHTHAHTDTHTHTHTHTHTCTHAQSYVPPCPLATTLDLFVASCFIWMKLSPKWLRSKTPDMMVVMVILMYVFICPLNKHLGADGTLLLFVFDPDTSSGYIISLG